MGFLGLATQKSASPHEKWAEMGHCGEGVLVHVGETRRKSVALLLFRSPILARAGERGSSRYRLQRRSRGTIIAGRRCCCCFCCLCCCYAPHCCRPVRGNGQGSESAWVAAAAKHLVGLLPARLGPFRRRLGVTFWIASAAGVAASACPAPQQAPRPAAGECAIWTGAPFWQAGCRCPCRRPP